MAAVQKVVTSADKNFAWHFAFLVLVIGQFYSLNSSGFTQKSLERGEWRGKGKAFGKYARIFARINLPNALPLRLVLCVKSSCMTFGWRGAIKLTIQPVFILVT
jgi:hypothetical protein